MTVPLKVVEPLLAPIDSALRTIATERDGLDLLGRALAGPLGHAFTQAVEIIAAATGRTIVTGMGKSGHVGRKIAATFASTGTPSHFVHPGEASHGDMGMIRPDDVILALSWSGETRELSDIITYAKRFRVPLVAMTSRTDSALGEAASLCLTIPKAEEACPNGLAPTTSTTMQLALGDALALALLETRGFSAQDFHQFHPGGKLGAQLKQVRSVMHAGERLPRVPIGTTMADAIVTQSRGGLGCVVVVGSEGGLAGIVTDGDLRRHMAPDLLARTVDEIMTRNAATTRPETLLGEALEMLESRNISALVVMEGGRPVGLVKTLDLLRAGVA